MSDGGKVYVGNKIDLLACLLDCSEYHSDALVLSTVIIDVAVNAQMQKFIVVKDFDDHGFHSIHFNIQFQNAVLGT